MSESQQIRAVDDIDRLRDHCLACIEPLTPSHARSLALSKLGEMIFWLRAHQARQRLEMGDGVVP